MKKSVVRMGSNQPVPGRVADWINNPNLRRFDGKLMFHSRLELLAVCSRANEIFCHETATITR